MTLKEHMNIGRRLIKLLYSLSRRYFYFLICASVVKAVTPYIPIWFSARLIDALAAGAPLATLVTYAALTVGLSTVLGVLRHWLNAQKAVGSSEVMARHEWKYAEKAMHLSYSSIEDRDVMLLSERIKDETNTGYNIFYLVSAVEMLTGSATQIIASLALTASFFASHAIPLWAKLVFVAGVAVTVTLRIFTVGKSSKLQVDYYSGCTYYNTVLTKFIDYIDDYTGGMDIRLYGMEASLAGHADGTYRELCRGEETMRIRAACLNLITTVSHYALRLGVYLILISAALGGGMTVGSIAQYVSSVMLLLTAISGIVSAVQLSLVNHGYAKRYFSYFDIPNDMYRGTLSVEKRDDDEYYIEFRDVSFKYPNTGSYALRHVSLKFRIGEKLAVVGMNGSGKTTFIKLLCRLYDPTEGEILLNGVDIRKYDYDEYMSVFSVVFQDFRLFAFPLGQNVAAGADYDREKAKACLGEAGFGERLAGMPEGLDTPLYHSFDKSGVEISGGEAQKIALARALYKNAPFIVLDEPTAALDPVSEYEVYRKFNEISGGKTAVYISHRLASCRFCDKIAVFDGGHIVQRGTHEELIADANGKYAELWNAQAQYYTEKADGPEAPPED